MLKPPIANPQQLRHGDKVWVRGQTLGVERHYLIYDQKRNAFLHNTFGGVQYAPAAEFPFVFVEKRATPGFEDVVVERARALLGTPYDILDFNCEHYANYVHEGKSESPQLQRAATWLAVLAGAWLVSRSSNVRINSAGQRFDKRNGQYV